MKTTSGTRHLNTRTYTGHRSILIERSKAELEGKRMTHYQQHNAHAPKTWAEKPDPVGRAKIYRFSILALRHLVLTIIKVKACRIADL